MAGKSHAISVRLSQQDYDFLTSYQDDSATTLSDKLRQLVSLARYQADNAEPYDFQRCTEALSRYQEQVHDFERAEGIHSELLHSLLVFQTQCLSHLSLSSTLDREQLSRCETDLTEQLFRTMGQILRMAITEQGPCYQPALVSEQVRHLKPTLDTLLSLPHLKSE